MKILICLYKIENFGGITTYVEELSRGFRQLGHDTSLLLLGSTDRAPYVKGHTKRPGSWPSRFPGMTVNPDTGWGGVEVWSYATKERIREFRKRVESEFDLLIWGVPVPSWSGLSAVPEWRRLYDVKIPQIAVIHDGNFRYLYPHLNAVAQSLRGVACVHGSAYGSARMFDGKYAFIPNPHPLVPLTKDWEEKKKIVVCAHMWKAWKHMEYAVHAAPHLKSSRLLLGGDGIERRYMTSPTKCKDKYLGIWRNMMDSGKAKYLDILPNPKLMEIYDRSRVMFDPSFSKNYNKLGSHFNRSLFESYNHGVVPVAIESNMQLPGIFKEGVTHIGLPDTLNPKQIAATLDRAVNLSSVEAGRIVSAGRKLIKERFRAKVVAQNLLDLAEGKDCGLTDRLTKGEPTKEMVAAMENILQGGPPRSRVPDAAPSKRSGRALF